MDFLISSIIPELISLTVLEIILGIDNVVFIALAIAHLPQSKKSHARCLGLSLAFILRVAILFIFFWIFHSSIPTFFFLGFNISIKDILLGLGGCFLIFKSLSDLYQSIAQRSEDKPENFHGNFYYTVFQIILVDIVFSFDSVMVAVAVSDHIGVIVLAMGIAMFIMLACSAGVGHFITEHPRLKILALFFIFLIGILLLVESIGIEISKNYVYVAMLVSLAIEGIDILRQRKK